MTTPRPEDGFDWVAAEDQFRDVVPISVVGDRVPGRGKDASASAGSGAEKLIGDRNFEAAARRLRRRLSSHPDDLNDRRLLGWAQLGLTDLAGAAASAAAVTAAAPDDPDAQLLAAAVHSARGQTEQARAAAQRAIRLAPDHPAPYRMAAAVDIDADLVSEATLTNALRAVELAPGDAGAQLLAGSALLDLRRRKQAGEFLRRAAELDPVDPAIKVELARWNTGRGRTGAAAEGLAAVVRSDPANPVAGHNLHATLWRTFGIAQLVLWAAVVLLSRLRLFTGGDPAAWSRVVGPVGVVLALATWAFLLRGSRRGLREMLGTVRGDRTLQIGLLAHLLCLVALPFSVVRGRFGEISLIVGIALLLVATGSVWLRSRQERRRSPAPS